ncbi:unnamed protein product, partial [Effrenium voratum]
ALRQRSGKADQALLDLEARAKVPARARRARAADFGRFGVQPSRPKDGLFVTAALYLESLKM